MNWQTLVVLKLLSCIFNLNIGFPDHLIELLHPFGDDSEDWGRLHKENRVIYFWISIERSIFIDFASDEKLGVGFDFFKVHLVLVGLLSFLLDWPFMDGQEYFTEQFRHHVVEVIILLVCFFYHVVDNSHNLWCIISIGFLPKDGNFISADAPDDVKFGPTLVVDWGYFGSKGNIWVLNLGLRILGA